MKETVLQVENLEMYPPYWVSSKEGTFHACIKPHCCLCQDDCRRP